MRYGIIGDIHGNLDALEAVLEELNHQNVETILCIGDIVGYGAEPLECVQLLRRLGIESVAGNHDYAAAELLDITYFNETAKEAIRWTREQLDPETLRYLAELDLVKSFDSFVIVHSSLNEPANFEYILSWQEAQQSLDCLPEGKACFFGHSHVPLSFLQGSNLLLTADPIVDLRPFEKALINVGSVGQPRDQNPEASTVVFDDEAKTVTRHRVAYDIESAAAKISKAGLPAVLGERLRIGQ